MELAQIEEINGNAIGQIDVALRIVIDVIRAMPWPILAVGILILVAWATLHILERKS